MSISDNSTLDTARTVEPNSFPFYTTNAVKESKVSESEKKELWINASSLANYKVSRASAPSPNTLVPLDLNGKVPLSTIPALAGSSAIIGATGTYAALKASPLAGLYFAWATDLGAGTLVFYTANASIGDGGWLIIGGG